jgi:hypothetical protein
MSGPPEHRTMVVVDRDSGPACSMERRRRAATRKRSARPCAALRGHSVAPSHRKCYAEVLRLAISAAFLSSNLSDRLGHVLRADLRIALYHAQAVPSAELHQCAQIDASHH